MTQAREGLGTTTAALVPSGNVIGQAAGAYQSAETLLGQVLSSRPDYNRYGNHAYERDPVSRRLNHAADKSGQPLF